jgi:hypothetical protein
MNIYEYKSTKAQKINLFNIYRNYLSVFWQLYQRLDPIITSKCVGISRMRAQGKQTGNFLFMNRDVSTTFRKLFYYQLINTIL